MRWIRRFSVSISRRLALAPVPGHVSGRALGLSLGLAFAVAALAPAAQAEWQTPVNLGPTINSTYNDWYPVIARDGSYMIFVSTRAGGQGGSDLWISRNVGGQWQQPQNLGPNVNTGSTESAPFLAENDSTLYFLSMSTGGGDIYSAQLVDGVPAPRQALPSPINFSGSIDCCPVLSHDGQRLYICSDRTGTIGSIDLWVSQRSGDTWGTPVNMGPAINTAATDCPRWISDDGSTLLICSTRTDGLGNADMWVTEFDGIAWSAPSNMGEPLNSSAAEWGAWFTDSNGALGGTIYFGSGRNGGSGGWDIWYASEGASSLPVAPGDGAPALHGDASPILRACPNPAAAGTTLSYALAEPARVVIGIYDAEGRLLRTLLDAEQTPGQYQAHWDAQPGSGSGVSPDVCFCKMQAGKQQVTRKLILTE
jgi:hypothetical protein